MDAIPAEGHPPSHSHRPGHAAVLGHQPGPILATAHGEYSHDHYPEHSDPQHHPQHAHQPQQPQHQQNQQQPQHHQQQEHQRQQHHHEQQQQQQQHHFYRREEQHTHPHYTEGDAEIPPPLQDHRGRLAKQPRHEHAYSSLPEPVPYSDQQNRSLNHRSSAHTHEQSGGEYQHAQADPGRDDNHHGARGVDPYARNQEHERLGYAIGHGRNGGGGGSNGDGMGSSSNSNIEAGPSGHHPRTRSAPHSFHIQPLGPQSASSRSATVSHHPNALNRYPFSIPSISAKLDQPPPEDGNDALSSLWKKTTPIQEPYFQTRHTIASQHTLSTLGGVLFSLDEVPTEFTQDMYIAMRNRIFELEAKSVNYSPFASSRKRSIDRSGLDDYSRRYGHDADSGHYSKRPSHSHLSQSSARLYGPPEGGRPRSPVHRYSSSYPSWYTPEVYTNGSQPPPHHQSRHPSEQEKDPRSFEKPYDQDSHPGSRPGSPSPTTHSTAPSAIRPAYSPPPSARHPPLYSRSYPDGPLVQELNQDERGPSGSSRGGVYLPGHTPQQPGNGPPSHHSQPPYQPQNSQHLPAQPPTPLRSSQDQQHPPQPPHGYHQQKLPPQHPSQANIVPPGGAQGMAEARQSIHQQRHRAQQQAQSAHSRSYHLHKHMRMLDQQRAAQLAAQQQQQQHLHQNQQPLLPQRQQQGHPVKPIQRHYQPHQQMYPVHNQPVPIKPHPAPPSQLQQLAQQQAQQSQQSQQQPQLTQQQAMKPSSSQPQPRLTQQQQILQRYQQHRQVQQKQLQLRQLHLLRGRQGVPYPTQKNSLGITASPGSHSPTPPRVFGSQVDGPIKKATRPLECSNCMALDSLTWRPKVEPHVVTPDGSTPSGAVASSSDDAQGAGSKILCPACTQYLQQHGKPRPVPPFRTNFLKKIHTRFKRELQEVRFQGWQDAQVLEIEDRMVEREFQMVFNGLDESDASQIQCQPPSTTASPAPPIAVIIPAGKSSASSSDLPAVEGEPAAAAPQSSSTPTEMEAVVIKIEDDDDIPASLAKSKPKDTEVRTFQSEASVGELFGHRWRTEPVVGYTLVHFGGSDRTRMVPMNPTVPSLTITFNRSAQTITFAFRVLVNGLCLLSSGGGPPALHMPEMADDDESEEEEEEEIVVVPDNDKDAPSSSPPAGVSATPTATKADTPPLASSRPESAPPSSNITDTAVGAPVLTKS